MAVRSALLYRKKFSFETTQKAKITEKRETNNYGYTSDIYLPVLMDSGKTSLITQTLQENDFGIGSRSLIIACEDGDEEYDEEALAKDKITVVAYVIIRGLKHLITASRRWKMLHISIVTDI